MPRGGYDEFEIEFRVTEVWVAFLKQRAGFFLDAEGHEPYGPPPTLTKAIEKDIARALKEYDGHLLGPEQRSAWYEESKVRAAGIGLWFDRWNTGRHANNDVRNGGRRYVEAWRPWKVLRGKPDPIERFSELYWTVKAAQQRHK
jgi:hypothetical protein